MPCRVIGSSWRARLPSVRRARAEGRAVGGASVRERAQGDQRPRCRVSSLWHEAVTQSDVVAQFVELLDPSIGRSHRRSGLCLPPARTAF